MTTILKALRELERRGTAATPRTAAWTEPKAERRWMLPAAALLATAGGALALVTLLRGREAPHPETIPASAPPAQVAPQEPSSSSSSAPVPMPAKEEPPWGRVEKQKPVPPPVAAAAAPHPAQHATKPTRKSAVPQTARSESGPHEVAADEAEQPEIRVTSIGYWTDPARRTVTLRLRGGRDVTLREGQSAGRYEVQLILPDSVYLRDGASVFSIAP